MCTKILPEFFKRFENDLSQKIKTGKDPFLGLFTDYLGSATKGLLLNELCSSTCPAKNFIENMRFYPALISTLLIERLLEEFGQHGYFEVYPIFEELFGDDLNTTTREKLWKNFRQACLSLGLTVSHRFFGTHYMVDEYLYQAGLPLQYVGSFTETAFKYAARIGLPDEDDPEEIKLWQQGLMARLTPPFPKTARKAVENDDGCYYTYIFTRLLTSPPADENGLSAFEKKMRESMITGQTQTKVFKTVIPQLIIRDLEYGVLLPAVKDETWKIIVNYHDSGEETKVFDSYGDEFFEPFSEALPAEVKIENVSGFSWQYKLWEDERNNRLLIFSLPDGKFVSWSSLAEKERYLNPGNYALLLRFVPTEDHDLEPMSEDPALYVREINLPPGSMVPISRGPATLHLKPHNIPALNWIGDSLRGVKGNELYATENLQLEVSLPAEFLVGDHNFELRFKSASLGDDLILELEIDVNGKAIIDVARHLKDWGPGVSRVVASLHRYGSQRALTRTSAVIWNGLSMVERRVRFYCDRLPKNLEEEFCVNLKREEGGEYYTFHDETNRFFKMVFKDGKGHQQFTWAVPGIFLSLLTFVNQETRERNIPLGSTIAINPTSRKVLQIFSTNPGRLQLGSFNPWVNFSRLGSKKVPLASLLEYVGADGNTLTFTDEEIKAIVPLVSLVAPCTALEFNVESNHGLRKVFFTTASSIEAVKITANNLASEERYQLELSAEMPQGKLLPENKVTMFCESEDQVALYFELPRWLPGLWIIEFAVLTAGRWGTLCNAENKIFADGLLRADEESAGTKEEVYACIHHYCRQEIVDTFSRIHRALQHNFAPVAWGNLAWLEWFWAKLCGWLERECGDDPEVWLQLLKLACRWPDDTFMDGSVPVHNLGATLPKMFSLPKEAYRTVYEHSSSIFSCISFLPQMVDFMAVIRQQDIDVALLGGFVNFAEVATGQADPEGFSLARYQAFFASRDFEERRRLLNNDQWLPGKGDFLGPMHYRFAFAKLQNKFTSNKTIESETRGKALSMVKKVFSLQPATYVASNRYTNFDQYVLIYLQPKIDPENDCLTDEESALWDHLHRIERFLSLFAHACRCEARFPDEVLSTFKKLLMKKYNLQYQDLNKIIGYLLFIGEEIFAFYLLLWEAVFTADCDRPRRTYVRN